MNKKDQVKYQVQVQRLFKLFTFVELFLPQNGKSGERFSGKYTA